MTTRFITDGRVLDFVAGSAVISGQVLIVGAKIGVALAAIAAGATGSVRIAGVFSVNKLSTDVVAQGVLLYWDNAASRMTLVSAGNTLAGNAYAAAGNGATTVQVLLNGAS